MSNKKYMMRNNSNPDEVLGVIDLSEKTIDKMEIINVKIVPDYILHEDGTKEIISFSLINEVENE